MHEDQVISELLGGNESQLESALESNDEPTPIKKKKKKRNNRQNAAEAEKSAMRAKENEATPLQLAEGSIEVLDSNNITKHSKNINF